MGAGAKILIIDDDNTFNTILRLELAEQGYQVMTATSGPEGLRKAFDHKPDIILLDIMMAEMDGFTTCQRLRELSPHVSIIILSSKGLEKDIVKGLKLGADDYLVKPVRLLELRARIKARLRRSKGLSTTPHYLAAGDLTINLEKRLVMVRGEKVDLAPKAFSLLAYLMQNEGKALSHDNILGQAWGPEYVGEKNLLKYWIHYLRQKIEDDATNPKWIHTVRGLGYMFCW